MFLSYAVSPKSPEPPRLLCSSWWLAPGDPPRRKGAQPLVMERPLAPGNWTAPRSTARWKYCNISINISYLYIISKSYIYVSGWFWPGSWCSEVSAAVKAIRIVDVEADQVVDSAYYIVLSSIAVTKNSSSLTTWCYKSNLSKDARRAV